MDAVSHADDLHLRLRRSWPLLAGLMLLAGLWLGPLPEMARRAFSAHMILHLLVIVVAAPLMVVGLMRWLPHSAGTLRWPLLAGLGASAFEFAVVWGWHAPALHEAAAADRAIFAMQQASFLLAGVAVWAVALATRSRSNFLVGAITMLFTSMHMAMLGVLLVLAPSLLYAPQFCLGAFGLDPLPDQQLGGGLMALFGASTYAAGGAWIAFQAAKS